MTVKHGKKDYYQILLDPHRSELLKEIIISYQLTIAEEKKLEIIILLLIYFMNL